MWLGCCLTNSMDLPPEPWAADKISTMYISITTSIRNRFRHVHTDTHFPVQSAIYSTPRVPISMNCDTIRVKDNPAVFISMLTCCPSLMQPLHKLYRWVSDSPRAPWDLVSCTSRVLHSMELRQEWSLYIHLVWRSLGTVQLLDVDAYIVNITSPTSVTCRHEAGWPR